MAKCDVALDDVVAQIEEFATTLNPAEKRFFDSYMLGSLFKQDNELKTVENRVREQAKEEGWSDEAKNNALTSARKGWWKTNFQQLGFGLDVVDPNSVSEFGNRYNEIVQATFKEDLTDNQTRELIGRAQVDEAPALESTLEGASTLNEAPAIESFSDTFLDRVWSISEDAERAGLFDGSKKTENLARVQQIKRILRDNPNMRTHFADLFASTTSKINEDRGGIGVTPSRASLDDLDVFARYMKRVANGDGLLSVTKGEKVPWWAYFVFPDTIGRITDPFDQVRVKQLRKVITENGPKDVEIYEFNSTATVVQRFMNSAVDAMDGENAQVVQRLVNRFGYLRTAMGADADKMFSAVVAKMEYDVELAKENPKPEKLASLGGEWKQHKADYDELTAKSYVGALPGQGRRKLSGTEIAEQLKRSINEHTKEDYGRFIRNDEAEKRFFVMKDDGELNVQRTLQKVQDHFNRTGEFPKLGMQGLYRLIYEVKLRHRKATRVIDGEERGVSSAEALRDGMGEAYAKNIRDQLRAQEPFREIGRVKDGYFPHMNWPQKAVKEHLLRKLEEAQKEGQSEEDMRRLESRIRREYGQGTLKDEDLTEEIRDVIMGGEVTTRSAEEGPLNFRPGNTLSRSDDQIPGWGKSIKELEMYGHKMSTAYHKMLGSLLSDRQIRQFEAREAMGATTPSWARFMRLYVARSIGNPSVFPREYLEDKDLSLHKKPYWYFTDQFMEEKMRSADKKFFGNRMFTQDGQVGDTESRVFQRRLAWASNMNAKWELMSLLARTKSYVNNLSQGLNTAISTGFDPWKKAASLRYLKSNLVDENGNAMFGGWDDVRKFVESHGGVESFIVDEAGITGRFDSAKVRAFINDASDHIRTSWREGKDANDRTLKEIADKHGIGDSIVNAGAWFMRASERRVRMHAFMAHYIKAREALEANGFTHGANDPWVIELARRGTTATQFMYNASFRPAFTASSFGKVATRFQLWAWQSIKFRRDIYRRASLFGFKQGTPEFERFRRMAMLDMLGFALASLFPASLFEATLPQPLGYLQDLSDFFFGQDPEERERAFFGTLPYPLNVTQIVLPPSSRYFTAWVKPLMTGDWDRFTSYHIWSMFPFGLMARDTKNTLQSPLRVVENITGFPLMRVHQELKKRQETEGEGFGLIGLE